MLGFNSSKGIPKFTNHYISESNMRCDIYIKELWHDMSKKVELLKELHFIVRALNKPDTSPREKIPGVYKNS